MDIEDLHRSIPDQHHDKDIAVDQVISMPNRKPHTTLPDKTSVMDGGGRWVWIQSYGCGHNQSDGEVMAGLLSSYG
jgi:hypothetical protein